MFYWDVSGQQDSTRVIVFTTENNLRLLQTHREWLSDGYFDLAPERIFKQVYSIHIIVNNKDLPMVYGFLPNKSQKTYEKYFQMIKNAIQVKPRAINMDFEKATMNAAITIFECQIFGCFFHLSQNFFKKVQEKNMIDYTEDNEFRLFYKYLQALAFLPESDVIEGFLFIKIKASIKLEPILLYLETYYIGKLVKFSRSVRDKPNFPIPTWNLYQRVLDEKPRATNSVEAWHAVVTPDIKRNMPIEEVINLFRKEQGMTETWLTQLSTGVEHKKKKSSIQFNNRLKNIVLSYDKSDIMDYLKKIALIL